MMGVLAFHVLLAATMSPASSARTLVTPVQQVIAMMTDMKAKAEKTVEAEKKTYATYSEWVDDQSKELGFNMKTTSSNIEQEKADIATAESCIAQQSAEVEKLDGEIAALEADLSAATSVRNTQRGEFETVQQDYTESIYALEQAVQTLSAQAYDRAQAEALLQRMSTRTRGMRRVLAAFLQEGSGRQPGAPEVAGYEFQSHGIVDLLEGLLKKFKDELAEAEEEESNSAHAYDLESMHLTDTIKASKGDREEHASIKARCAKESAKVQGELAESQQDLADDKKLLAEIKATFAAKSGMFEENQKVRADELAALAKAIEIISSPEVAASYSDHINLAQRPMSLLQLRRSSSKEAAAKQEALKFLKRRATVLSSSVLASAVSGMASGPFDKVIEMIENLLARLKEEAQQEADHKEWCDKELKANKLKREKKMSHVEKLSAEVEELTATIADMADQLAKLAQEQAELTKAMSEATNLRTSEKAENEEKMADADAGKEAVGRALTILKEFYASQSFLQQVPEMAAYKGMQGAKGGVVGMLEVIESDFARLKSETHAAESQAAQAYAEFMSDAKASKLAKHNSEVKLKLDKDQTEFEKGRKVKDLKGVEAELAKANQYYEELKPMCLTVHVSYEERVAGRKEEIEALKQAYAILDQKSSE